MEEVAPAPERKLAVFWMEKREPGVVELMPTKDRVSAKIEEVAERLVPAAL